MNSRFKSSNLFIFLLTSLLFACGGGGSSGTPNPPPATTTPTPAMLEFDFFEVPTEVYAGEKWEVQVKVKNAIADVTYVLKLHDAEYQSSKDGKLSWVPNTALQQDIEEKVTIEAFSQNGYVYRNEKILVKVKKPFSFSGVTTHQLTVKSGESVAIKIPAPNEAIEGALIYALLNGPEDATVDHDGVIRWRAGSIEKPLLPLTKNEFSVRVTSKTHTGVFNAEIYQKHNDVKFYSLAKTWSIDQHFLEDWDNDGRNEIVALSNSRLVVLKWDALDERFIQLWSSPFIWGRGENYSFLVPIETGEPGKKQVLVGDSREAYILDSDLTTPIRKLKFDNADRYGAIRASGFEYENQGFIVVAKHLFHTPVMEDQFKFVIEVYRAENFQKVWQLEVANPRLTHAFPVSRIFSEAVGDFDGDERPEIAIPFLGTFDAATGEKEFDFALNDSDAGYFIPVEQSRFIAIKKDGSPDRLLSVDMKNGDLTLSDLSNNMALVDSNFRRGRPDGDAFWSVLSGKFYDTTEESVVIGDGFGSFLLNFNEQVNPVETSTIGNIGYFTSASSVFNIDASGMHYLLTFNGVEQFLCSADVCSPSNGTWRLRNNVRHYNGKIGEFQMGNDYTLAGVRANERSHQVSAYFRSVSYNQYDREHDHSYDSFLPAHFYEIGLNSGLNSMAGKIYPTMNNKRVNMGIYLGSYANGPDLYWDTTITDRTSFFTDNGLDFNRMNLAPDLRMNATSRVFSVQGMPTIYGIDDSGIISAFDAVSLSSSQFTNPVQTENWQTYVDGQWVPLPFGPSRKKFLSAGNGGHPALIMQDRQKFEAFRVNNSDQWLSLGIAKCTKENWWDPWLEVMTIDIDNDGAFEFVCQGADAYLNVSWIRIYNQEFALLREFEYPEFFGSGLVNDYPAYASDMISDRQTLIVRGMNGQIAALSLINGKILWKSPPLNIPSIPLEHRLGVFADENSNNHLVFSGSGYLYVSQ